LKANLETFDSFKKEYNLMGKRDRVIKGGWRHGVTGIEDADVNSGSVFYDEALQQKLASARNKDEINRRRLKSKYLYKYSPPPYFQPQSHLLYYYNFNQFCCLTYLFCYRDLIRGRYK
jgi:hypothetical protein